MGDQAEVDSGRRPGTSTGDAQRIAELERENRDLRRANDNPESSIDSLRDRARRSTEEVVAFIDAHRSRRSGGLRWGVEPICEVLEIAPSTYYSAKARPPSARDSDYSHHAETLAAQGVFVEELCPELLKPRPGG